MTSFLCYFLGSVSNIWPWLVLTLLHCWWISSTLLSFVRPYTSGSSLQISNLLPRTGTPENMARCYHIFKFCKIFVKTWPSYEPGPLVVILEAPAKTWPPYIPGAFIVILEALAKTSQPGILWVICLPYCPISNLITPCIRIVCIISNIYNLKLCQALSEFSQFPDEGGSRIHIRLDHVPITFRLQEHSVRYLTKSYISKNIFFFDIETVISFFMTGCWRLHCYQSGREKTLY